MNCELNKKVQRGRASLSTDPEGDESCGTTVNKSQAAATVVPRFFFVPGIWIGANEGGSINSRSLGRPDEAKSKGSGKGSVCRTLNRNGVGRQACG